MTEAQFQTKFSRWWKESMAGCGKFELKFVDLNKKKSLNYKSCIPDHQRIALNADRVAYKIPDDSIGQKPFDFIGTEERGYLVVQFWKRGVKYFYTIPISNILEDINMGYKSLNEDRAKMLGTRFTF